jgi:hypothetical protein
MVCDELKKINKITFCQDYEKSHKQFTMIKKTIRSVFIKEMDEYALFF